MTVGHIPDEHLAVEGVAGRKKESIVVRECKVANLMVMFTQPVDRLLLLKVPHNDVRVLATLTRSK